MKKVPTPIRVIVIRKVYWRDHVAETAEDQQMLVVGPPQ